MARRLAVEQEVDDQFRDVPNFLPPPQPPRPGHGPPPPPPPPPRQEARTNREDQQTGPDLPNYDQAGQEELDAGRSAGRFGRWRGWIEKRAGERYLDEEQAREDAGRDQRHRSRVGWGPGVSVLPCPLAHEARC